MSNSIIAGIPDTFGVKFVRESRVSERHLVASCCNGGITRVIQKISSVCEYCPCGAAVSMVRMRAEFVDSVARHGRNLQTFKQCLRTVLCVYNV